MTPDQLRAHWAGRERYTVWFSRHDEALVERCRLAWRADPARPGRLHLIAMGDAVSALPGFARLPQAGDDDGAITLDVLAAPPALALARLTARIDAVCLAGADFDPDCARPLARLLARGALLWAPALAEAPWTALAATGWQRAGAGDTHGASAIFATRKPFPPAPPPPRRRAIVIGAGLAGAAACQRLCARGWEVTLVERHPQAASEASGNRAGITLPLLSKDDNLASRLSRASYLFALRYWARLGGVGDVAQGAAIEGSLCGVLLAARDEAHARLQGAIAAARCLPPGYAAWHAAGQGAPIPCFERVAPHGAWLFPGGGWIRPASAVAAMLDACGARLTRRFGTGDVTLARAASDEWQVRDGAGDSVASAPTVIVASGAGALAQIAHLPLQPVRGQVTHVHAAADDGFPELDVVLCREAYLTPAAGGIRSIGATYDDDLEPALRQRSQDENLSTLRAMLADAALAAQAPLAGRVGFRAVALDRLPLVGALPQAGFAAGAERLRELPRQPGLYGLLGYASRGLTWAPLAAELLAASLEGEPLPLERELADALDPGRFLLRARRSRSAGLR